MTYETFSPVFRLIASGFFGGLALMFLGLAVFMAYETAAIWTRIVPTISDVTAFEFLRHPLWWVTIACGLSFAFGALVTHFTHWTP